VQTEQDAERFDEGSNIIVLYDDALGVRYHRGNLRDHFRTANTFPWPLLCASARSWHLKAPNGARACSARQSVYLVKPNVLM
jgi:hypothetical protein